MDKLLYNYLESEWRINNHVKYLKYFKEWYSNITDNQKYHFTRQMKYEN